MPLVRQQSQGYTLLELMIATGLMGIFITIIYTMISQFFQAQSRSDHHEWALETNREILGIIRQNFKFQTSHTINSGGKELKLRRKKLQLNPNQPIDNFDVFFTSQCSPLSSVTDESHRQMLTKVYSGQNAARFAATANKCIHSLGCPKTHFPQVKITAPTNDPRVPKYPVTFFPTHVAPSSQVSSGTSICITQLNNIIRIVAESVFVTDKTTGQIGIRQDETLLSANFDTDLEVIPEKI